ncbi:MAG: DNA repair protein RecO [Bacillaceae bacterium]
MLQRIEGIVIRSVDYGESNKIITIFSRELGKLSVMARGAKKANSRLSACTQHFTYGYFLIQKGKGMGTLQQGEIISTFRELREDIFLTAYASYVVELTDRGTEEGKNNPFLFELLYQTLNYMNEGVDMQVLMHIYQVKMLPVLGLYPSFDRCAHCGATQDSYRAFSLKEGGFLCSSCRSQDKHALQIFENTSKLIRLFYHFNLNRLGNVTVKDETKKQLSLILDGYYDEYSGLYLKSRRFLKQLDLFQQN